MYIDLHCLFLSGLPLRGAHEFKWRLEAYDSTLTLLEFVVSFTNQYALSSCPPLPLFLAISSFATISEHRWWRTKNVLQHWSHHFSPYMSCHHIQLLSYPSHKKMFSICSNQRQIGCKKWVQEVASIIVLYAPSLLLCLAMLHYQLYVMIAKIQQNKTLVSILWIPILL